MPALKEKAAPAKVHAGIRKIKAAQTEAALKEAARRMFARRGYLNTKITDITQQARRSPGSFYNHFSSKEELLEALVADMFAEAKQRIAGEGFDHDLSDRTQLRAHLATVWHAYRNHLPEFVALMQASMVNKDFARRWRELRAGKVEIMQEHLDRVRAAGFQLPGDPAIVALALTSMMEQFCYIWFVAHADQGRGTAGRAVTDKEVIDTLTSFALRGIIGTELLSIHRERQKNIPRHHRKP